MPAPLNKALGIAEVKARILWGIGLCSWLCGSIAAFAYREALSSSILGMAIFAALAMPLLLLIRIAFEALCEGLLMVLFAAAFKLVTFGRVRTEFTSKTLVFPWHGFARDPDGVLVASESAVLFTGALVWAAGIAAAYLWFR